MKDISITVFFDIKRAFDTVWQEGLVSKLYSFGVNPSLVKIIDNFLQGRTFSVVVGDYLSTKKPLRVGLPQGAVLSPALYNLYTADFPKLTATSIFSYADDIALLASCRDERLAHFRVQAALDQAAMFFDKWKLQPHPAKTQTITFTNRTALLNRPLTLKGEVLTISRTVKYLGITLDRRLTWGPHIQAAAKKGSQAIGIAYPLVGRDSALSLANKVLLYKQVIRPTFTYGSLVWGTAAPTHILKLQRVQNKFTRVATNAPPLTNLSYLQEELGIPSIKLYINTINLKKLQKSEHHENPLIPDSLNYIPVSRTLRNRPKTVLLNPENIT